MTLQTRWKNPPGADPKQLNRWAQDLITELRRGSLADAGSASGSDTWIDFSTYVPTRDGVTNDAAKLQSALNDASGQTLRIGNGGDIGIGTAVTVPANTAVLMYGSARFVKRANIDMFSLAGSVRLINVKITGTGATFTGKGIIIAAASNDQHLIDCNILDMNGFCIDVDNDGGVRMLIEGGTYQRTTTTNPAIRFANGGGTETVGERKLIGVQAAGGNLIDTNASQNTALISCSMVNLTLGANSLKTVMSGCRFATAGTDVTVGGSDHTMVGCIIAGGVTINSGSTGCRIGPNTMLSGAVVTDNSGATGANANIITGDPRTTQPIYVVASASAVNMNSVADTPLNVVIPGGYTRYRIQALMVYHASVSLAGAQYGLFTAAAGGGTAIVPATASTITTGAADTANSAQFLGPTPQAYFTDSSLFFRVTTALGGAGTADVALQIQPLP